MGYTGGNVGQYVRRHNPLSYISDAIDSPAQKQRLVPFTQFAADLAGDTLPNYSFLVPNLCHDAHDCTLDSADTWLRTNIKPLIDSPRFQQDGMLIILFDEASPFDATCGGGRGRVGGGQRENQAGVSVEYAVPAREHAAIDCGGAGPDGLPRCCGGRGQHGRVLLALMRPEGLEPPPVAP